MLRVFYTRYKPAFSNNRIVYYKVKDEEEIKLYLTWQQHELLPHTKHRKYLRNYIFNDDCNAKLKTEGDFQQFTLIYNDYEVTSAIYQYCYVGNKKTIVFYHTGKGRKLAQQKTRDPLHFEYVRTTNKYINKKFHYMPVYYIVLNREIFLCSSIISSCKQVWEIRQYPKKEFEIYELLGEEAIISSSVINNLFDDNDRFI